MLHRIHECRDEGHHGQGAARAVGVGGYNGGGRVGLGLVRIGVDVIVNGER